MSSMTASRPVTRISSGRIAFFLTLGVETVFFVTLLVAYFALRNDNGWNVSHTLYRLAIPVINSSILLASTIVAWRSNRAIHQNRRTELRSGLIVTLVMGLVFVAGQIFEFNRAGLRVDDQAFGGVFFTLLGFHAVHVLAGVVFLALNLMRTDLGDFSAEQHEAVDLGTWFWYYVAAVWLVLFTALYLI